MSGQAWVWPSPPLETSAKRSYFFPPSVLAGVPVSVTVTLTASPLLTVVLSRTTVSALVGARDWAATFHGLVAPSAKAVAEKVVLAPAASEIPAAALATGATP